MCAHAWARVAAENSRPLDTSRDSSHGDPGPAARDVAERGHVSPERRTYVSALVETTDGTEPNVARLD